jgi:sigma-B regulation protein RsbU (phosphoserine phosphatase)
MDDNREIPLDGSTVKLERLELALKASYEGIWDWSVDQTSIYYSRRILEFLECGDNQAPNLFLPPYESIHPEEQAYFSSAIQQALEVGGPEIFAVDVRVKTGSGIWQWLRIRAVVVRDRQGCANRITGSMIDISRRKTAEAQVIEERFQLRQLTDHIPVQVYFKDLDSCFVMANQRMADWLSLASSDDLIGKHDRNFFDKDHWKPAAEDERKIIESGEPITGQLEHETRRQGEETWVVTSKFPWRDRNGKIKGTFGVSSDVTSLVLAQRQATKLANQLQEKNEAYEEELQLAREVQQALATSGFPSITNGRHDLHFDSRYIPISGLAGDFFEVIKISQHQVGVLICDVMGHGVRAALIVAMLRGLLEKQRSQATDPSLFLRGLNEGLHAILNRAGATMFATAFYCLLDLSESSLTYACAGHPGPIVVSTTGVRQIAANRNDKGPGLGLLANAEYPSLHMNLDEVKRLVLFTDGVLEAENQQGEPFFENRLMQIIGESSTLPVDDMLDAILASVLGYTHSKHFDDDVCLLSLDIVSRGA